MGKLENQPRHLTDGDEKGTVFGQTAEDPIGFHGVAPTPMRGHKDQGPLDSSPSLAEMGKLVGAMRDVLVEKGLMKGEE